MRVYHSAYSTCADIMRKFIERPTLIGVWAISCPGLLKSKTKELALQEPGNAMYLTTLAEKMRIDMLYDAVAHLKNIENERPIRQSDIESKLVEVDKLAAAEARRIEAQEALMATELHEIGDGSDSVEMWVRSIEQARANKTLVLRGQGLFAVPPELFALVAEMEIVDLGENQLKELPAEVEQLHRLKKLYLDTNALATVPSSLGKLHEHLTLVALADNPLHEEFFAAYLAGLPRLFAFLRERRRAASSIAASLAASSASRAEPDRPSR
jgi:Leucine-rich repeat (LRR) protein